MLLQRPAIKPKENLTEETSVGVAVVILSGIHHTSYLFIVRLTARH